MLDLVENDTATNTYQPIEICRTRAIASLEVTSEQVAKSKVGAAVLFGVLGGVTAKSSMDRATMLVSLKNQETGYFTVAKQSTASLLGIIKPWADSHEIVLGPVKDDASQLAPSSAGPTLIADELAKLWELRQAGALTEEEFSAQKARLLL